MKWCSVMPDLARHRAGSEMQTNERRVVWASGSVMRSDEAGQDFQGLREIMRQSIVRWHGGFEDLRQRHDGRSRGSMVVSITWEGGIAVDERFSADFDEV
ncbi:hypothetical protein PanWU01x14_217440 [Parasponia andersonii]|uniref:Uncharacterized protein n=1 Tax=Parasponia andersonii TaxID=3476 RepID=A0A2P5BR96_PARAD|nr:hypothetical protein PanWU01x14_217440 [Parasponia andersonii]